ncbi:unnamed protein product [Paramecium pentaurelia]|uniref:RING-CH-type domain-containing protein n=1 Tax=Paramecium pentaurelia TaxID=43138 RepID=A0A8S1SBU4_9CILI|nr:unnamed protein product [Paramecium pentaurelia]
MDTTTAHNQPQIETFESKLITIQGTSSLPNEHVYRIRKTLHPQTTANQFHLSKTLNSSVNSVNQLCHICNKHTSASTTKYCACQDRQYHLLCLITHIKLEYKQGNGIMQCPYCNLYYPTVLQTNLSYQNLTKKQLLVYASAFLILLLLIIVEVTIMIAMNLHLPFYLFLSILITIELLILLRLIRKTIMVARIVRFSLKEYQYCDEIIQSQYAENSFRIISALKNNKAEQLFTE